MLCVLVTIACPLALQVSFLRGDGGSNWGPELFALEICAVPGRGEVSDDWGMRRGRGEGAQVLLWCIMEAKSNRLSSLGHDDGSRRCS